jgi:hypothetical protein
MNWMENFWERIYIIENVIDKLTSFSRGQAGDIKRSLIFLYIEILLKHFRNKKYLHIFLLLYKLLMKHIIISKKIRKKLH